MLLSPYHAGGKRPPAQVLRNSLSGHSRPAAVSASWLAFSPVAPPVARVPSKGSLALILPTSWAPSAYKAADGHAFRSAHVPRALFCTKFSTQPIHHHATIHVTQASRTQNSRRDLLSTGADESDLQPRLGLLSSTLPNSTLV